MVGIWGFSRLIRVQMVDEILHVVNARSGTVGTASGEQRGLTGVLVLWSGGGKNERGSERYSYDVRSSIIML